MFIALGALLVLSFVPSLVSAESGSVRYSYEQVEIGDRSQWVLVPRPEERLKGEVTADTIETAFNLLREAKGTSYGNTSIEVNGSAPERATVKVHIDPDYSEYKLIIMAETVYTLTELGVSEVRFPGFSEGAMGRGDIPFAAYTVTLPLWRALPPGKLVDARVRMPDGTILDTETLERRWSQKDQELVDTLFSYLKDERPYTVVSVAKRLPDLGIPYTSEVLPLLEHESSSVREAALKVLENKRDRSDVLEAVASLMEQEESDEIAEKAAKFLGASDSKEYNVYEPFFYLERGSQNQKVEAAKQLGKTQGQGRVVDRLGEALRVGGGEEEVASGAASSLLKLDAFETLADALEDGEVPGAVRMEIARGLAEKSDAGAQVDGYAYLGSNGSGHEAIDAVRSLGKVGTDGGRRAVESFLTSDDRRVREAAVETVVEVGSTESLSAIADAVRNSENAAAVEDAGVRILETQSISTILEFTQNSDSLVQRMAYRALGPKAASGAGGSNVFDRLKQGAGHSDPEIRGAAARGLGAFANDEALEVLKTMTDDSAAEVRRGVAYGLGNYSGGTLLDQLIAYLDDGSPEVVAAALAAIAERGEEKPLGKIKDLLESDEAIVRKNAATALASVVPRDDQQQVRKAISLLSGMVTSDEDDGVIRRVLRDLGTFEKERAVNGIAIMLNAEDEEMQLVAIEALGESGHKSAVDLLSDALSDGDAEVRRAAIEALGEVGGSGAKSALQNGLQEEEDAELKRLIERTIERM